MDDELVDVLERFLPGQQWQIRKPQSGWRKRSYIVNSARDRYFLKFDVPVDILKRLAEIGVAPRVLFSGQHNGLSFVIQEFIHGVHPESKAWMRRHVDPLAAIVQTYHGDEQLLAQLARLYPGDFAAHLKRDRLWLQERFGRCNTAYLKSSEIEAAFERLVASSGALEAASLVPIHNDPSPTNIMLSGDKFVFLDWDEITLSDPMRDIGLLLWWNFPPSQWDLFFGKYGTKLTSAWMTKIYWFAARASLDIALWHAEHGLNGTSFAKDFLAAIDQGENPQGY